METGPTVVREESTSNGLTKSTYCCVFATGQSFAQMEACELISLVRTVSESILLLCYLFCACANCEHNGMDTCQDQALCVGCVDLYQEST